jgi:hypothetical protein
VELPDHHASRQPAAEVLDYASPKSAGAGRQRSNLLAKLLAVAWVLGTLASGVSGDRVSFTTATKVGFTVAGGIILLTLCFTGEQGRVRRALAFGLLALWILGVMWFWN